MFCSDNSPNEFLASMGDGASGAVVVQFQDTADHLGNRERSAALLSTLGHLVCVYPADGLWSDLSVRLDAAPNRTHGVGENPFHMDLVDRDGAPRYIALYCERPDPAGGGASRLADTWTALQSLSSDDRNVLAASGYSYFSDTGVFGVGTHLDAFQVAPLDLRAGVPIRFTSKMLPHLERGELFTNQSGNTLTQKQVASAFARLVVAVRERAIEHLLSPGELLVFDQYRFAHARAPLGEGQADLAPDGRRLLKQTYVGVSS